MTRFEYEGELPGGLGPHDVDFESFSNDKYHVQRRWINKGQGAEKGEMIHLSFKTHDRSPATDWREKQQIKNELAGEEWEAVELYPAMSRIVDSSNQFHLWCFPVPLGIGFSHKLLTQTDALEGAIQRPFDPDLGWDKWMTTDAELDEMLDKSGIRQGAVAGRLKR